MTSRPSIVEQMQSVAQRLSDAYQQGDAFSQSLTNDAVSYIRTLRFQAQPDGSVLLKTPAMQDKKELHTFAEVVSRSLGYMGLELDPRQARVAHTDTMKDISLTAKRDDLDSIFSAATVQEYDHIAFKVTPEEMNRARTNLKNDERGALMGRMLEVMQPKTELKTEAKAKPQAVIQL